MEKYIKLSDIEELLEKLYDEPGYWHTGETFYAGISAVQQAIKDLPVMQVE